MQGVIGKSGSDDRSDGECSVSLDALCVHGVRGSAVLVAQMLRDSGGRLLAKRSLDASVRGPHRRGCRTESSGAMTGAMGPEEGDLVEVENSYGKGISRVYRVGRTIAVVCPGCGSLVRYKRFLGFAHICSGGQRR